MATLNFTTSGKMTIKLQGARFGRLRTDPHQIDDNVKRFAVNPTSIEIEVFNQKSFSKWGTIEVIEEGPSGGELVVEVDTNALGWYASAQFSLHANNGQHILNDNFQSLVGGMPSSLKQKRYNINAF